MTGGGVNLNPKITNPSVKGESVGVSETPPPTNPNQEDEDNGPGQVPSVAGVSPPNEDLLRIESLKRTFDSILNKVFVDNGPISAPNTAWPDPWVSNDRLLLTVEQAEAKVNFQQEREKTRRQRMADQALQNKNKIVFGNLQKSAQTNYRPTWDGVWPHEKQGLSVAQLGASRRLSTRLKRGSLAITLPQEIRNLLADYYPDEETDTWTNAIWMERLIALGFKKLQGKVTFNISAEYSNARVSGTINWELNLEEDSPQKVVFLVFADGGYTKTDKHWHFGTAGLESDKPSKITFVYRNGGLVVTDFSPEELSAWVYGQGRRASYLFNFGTALSVTSLSR